MTEKRVLVIGLILLLLVAGGVVDRSDRSGTKAVAVVAGGPAARAKNGGASTWYCPLANALLGANAPADGSIVIQNTQDEAIDGVLTLYPETGQPVTVAIRAPAASRLVAHESEFIKTNTVGAVVELERGGVAVDQTVSGPSGEATTPCATGAGDHWYVAEGSTALNNTMSLGLFNPFPEDAIVDLDFATDQGRTAPGAFQGLVVPARTVRAVNVGEHVRRRDHVAATVVARRGRLVVGRLQTRTSPRDGLALGLAAPAPSTLWDFPDGIASDAVTEHFNFYNPSDREATVQLALTLDQGAAEPLEVKVPAHERALLDVGKESRVPKGVGHATTARSDVAIVVERTLDYVPPAPRVGLSIALGATRTAREWLLPQGGASDTQEEWVVVHNIGRSRARISFTATTGGHRIPLDALQDVSVPAGQRRAVRLLDTVNRPDLPLVVSATQPVVVERILARVGKSGASQTIGIPVVP
jgi:hypothetical protein